MLTSARVRARQYGFPCTIRKSDIVVPAACPILGIAMVPGVGRQHDGSPTLDRRRPELGYVPGNVLVISLRANRIKNDATADELALVLRYARDS